MLITHASEDERFHDHPGLHLYGIESYIAVPLNRRDGSFFGTLCALDPQPRALEEESFDLFHLLAQLIAFELEQVEQIHRRDAQIEALEDFLAIAGHDLSQPLASLYGRLQLLERALRREQATPEILGRVEAILSHTRGAISLSTTLLDVARMQIGEFAVAPQQVELVGLVEQIKGDMRVLAPSHDFVVEAPPALEAWVDPVRFGQALRNLVQNAAKYAPDDCGPIYIRLREEEEGLSLQVQDHGIGVADADLPHLFERHYRASTALSTQVAGTGLGLYIVRQIVLAHGGSVEATHTDGGGLTVTLTLPRSKRL